MYYILSGYSFVLLFIFLYCLWPGLSDISFPSNSSYIRLHSTYSSWVSLRSVKKLLHLRTDGKWLIALQYATYLLHQHNRSSVLFGFSPCHSLCPTSHTAAHKCDKALNALIENVSKAKTNFNSAIFGLSCCFWKFLSFEMLFPTSVYLFSKLRQIRSHILKWKWFINFWIQFPRSGQNFCALLSSHLSQ